MTLASDVRSLPGVRCVRMADDFPLAGRVDERSPTQSCLNGSVPQRQSPECGRYFPGSSSAICAVASLAELAMEPGCHYLVPGHSAYGPFGDNASLAGIPYPPPEPWSACSKCYERIPHSVNNPIPKRLIGLALGFVAPLAARACRAQAFPFRSVLYCSGCSLARPGIISRCPLTTGFGGTAMARYQRLAR